MIRLVLLIAAFHFDKICLAHDGLDDVCQQPNSFSTQSLPPQLVSSLAPVKTYIRKVYSDAVPANAAFIKRLRRSANNHPSSTNSNNISKTDHDEWKWFCPHTWTKFGRKCYKAFMNSTSSVGLWKASLSQCGDYNGRLAIVDSVEAQQLYTTLASKLFLTSNLTKSTQLSSSSGVHQIWLGLTNQFSANRKDFEWIIDEKTQRDYRSGFFFNPQKKTDSLKNFRRTSLSAIQWAAPQQERFTVDMTAKNCGALRIFSDTKLTNHGKLIAADCEDSKSDAFVCEVTAQSVDSGVDLNGQVYGDYLLPDQNNNNTDQPLFEGSVQYDFLAGETRAQPPALKKLWPSGIVPYRLDEAMSSKHKTLIEQVILIVATQAAHTSLRFRAAEGEDVDYVFFTPHQQPSICVHQGVGVQGGAQKILVGERCFDGKGGHLAHELLHALGLPHEHQRADRDQYVVINFDNVYPKIYLSQFNKYSSTPRDSGASELHDLWHSVDYDFYSIMHYPLDAYSYVEGRLFTIDLLDKFKKTVTSITIGERESLSELDIAKLQLLYPEGPPSSSPSVGVNPNSDERVKQLQAAFNASSPNLRQRWQSSVIPYVFDNKLSSAERRRAREQMRIITEYAKCVKFIPRASEPNYVKLERSEQAWCSSKVDGGALKVIVGRSCSEATGQLLHAILATLGMPQEHRRPDRDKYIIVNYQNIDSSAILEFEKYQKTIPNWGDYSYDLESIMHFSPYAFSTDPGKKKTIEVNLLRGGSKWRVANAQLEQAQKSLSTIDKTKLSRLFCANGNKT